VPFFTAGNGWNLEETMQKATAWNMPLAPAVAKTWGNFTQLPLQIDSTFYWWVLRQQLQRFNLSSPTLKNPQRMFLDRISQSVLTRKFTNRDLSFYFWISTEKHGFSYISNPESWLIDSSATAFSMDRLGCGRCVSG